MKKRKITSNPSVGNHGSKSSYLVEETKFMDKQRRWIERNAERKWGRVMNISDPAEDNSATLVDQPTNASEATEDNGMVVHPMLANLQRFDGVAPELNANPPQAGTEARRKFDEELDKQKDAKEHRLGLGYTNAPKFNPQPNKP